MAARARCAETKTPSALPDCLEGTCRVVTREWPELRPCNDASDCVAIKGICSTWEAAAKAHQAEAAARIAEMAARLKCGMPLHPEAEPTPICRGRFCVPY